jgi:putative ABC transport system permease protein
MELDPDLPVYSVRTLEDAIDDARFIPHFLAGMFAVFAVAGLVLAAVGLYGVLAFTVVMRTQELGVRRALGATGRAIVGLLAGQGTWQLVVGLGCGVPLAALFGRLLAGELLDVAPFDPLTFFVVAAVVAATAVLASVLPVLRALAVDPAGALRAE